MISDNNRLNATVALGETLRRLRSYAHTAMRFHEPYEDILRALCTLGHGCRPGVVQVAIERAKERIAHLYTTRNAVSPARQQGLLERSLIDLEATISRAMVAE